MVDYEAMAMIEMENAYPAEVARLDILTGKEKDGTLTNEEKKELIILDKKLLREFDRIKLHWQLNWSNLSRDKKREWLRRIEERREANHD